MEWSDLEDTLAIIPKANSECNVFLKHAKWNSWSIYFFARETTQLLPTELNSNLLCLHEFLFMFVSFAQIFLIF